jgi:hypothetical protein
MLFKHAPFATLHRVFNCTRVTNEGTLSHFQPGFTLDFPYDSTCYVVAHL